MGYSTALIFLKKQQQQNKKRVLNGNPICLHSCGMLEKNESLEHIRLPLSAQRITRVKSGSPSCVV